jgi:uncharacterized repeat protein (TIGR01451 family)
MKASLAAGASFSVHITSPTSAATCGTVNNTASVSASNSGSVTPASASITVQCPSLTLTKSTTTSTAIPGQQINFTITLSNSPVAGTGTATGITLTDPLPNPNGASSGVNWTITAQSAPLLSGITCTISGSPPSQTLTCTATGGGPFSLAPGQSVSVTVSSPTTSASCGTYNNTVTVTASNNNPSTLTASATINVVCGLTPGGTQKVTGGGQITPQTTPPYISGAPGSFGFVAQLQNGLATGHSNWLDHGNGNHVNGAVSFILVEADGSIVFGGSGACILGGVMQTCSYKVKVKDNGEPGAGKDTYGITIGTGPLLPILLLEPTPVILDKGNIQFHPTQ